MEKLAVNGREYHIWFNSFEEMERELPKYNERQLRNQQELRDTPTGTYWFGHDKGFDGHLKLVRDGWPQYADVVRAVSQRIEANLDLSTVQAMTTDVRRRKRMRRDSGDTLHMTRVWNGDLDHAWDRPERVPRRAPSQRYATIYVDLSSSAIRNASEGIWRAACAMKINDLFTSAGIATEVWVGDSTGAAYNGRGVTEAGATWTGVCAKEFTQPLNEDRLAVLTSIGTLRTVCFMMLAAAPYEIRSSFGSPFNHGLVLPLRERLAKGERVIRIGSCWSMDDAKREIAAVAAALSNKEEEVA